MSKYSSSVQHALDYVQQHLQENLSPAYLFHNFEHTEEVVEVALKLSSQAKLNETEREKLLLAACFQYTGYVENKENFQDYSVQTAKRYLQGQGYASEKQKNICELILQNQAKNSPKTLLDKLLHDASWSFLGRKRFDRKQKLLRIQEENLSEEHISQIVWHQKILKILENHHFYTSWAQAAYAIKQNEHLVGLRQSIQKAQEAIVRKKTGKNFGRGVDTIYRITLRNHINLSSIADGKANMIIGVNASIISALIAVGGLGLTINGTPIDENITFAAPMSVLLLSSLAAIIFAILSAIPKVSTIPFTQEDIDSRKVSMLYFGNFLQLEKEEFVAYLRELKWDQEVLYDDLSRDLYNLGAVLKKKYELLTVAYRLFMGGLILSVVVFVVSYSLQ